MKTKRTTKTTAAIILIITMLLTLVMGGCRKEEPVPAPAPVPPAITAPEKVTGFILTPSGEGEIPGIAAIWNTAVGAEGYVLTIEIDEDVQNVLTNADIAGEEMPDKLYASDFADEDNSTEEEGVAAEADMKSSGETGAEIALEPSVDEMAAEENEAGEDEVIDISDTEYLFENLAYAARYSVTVTAYTLDEDGEKLYADPVSETADTVFPPLRTPLLAAETASGTEIILTWAAVSHASGYRLECTDNAESGAWSFLYDAGADEREYTNAGLPNSTTVFYRISALYGDHVYDPSDVVDATTSKPAVAARTNSGSGTNPNTSQQPPAQGGAGNGEPTIYYSIWCNGCKAEFDTEWEVQAHNQYYRDLYTESFKNVLPIYEDVPISWDENDNPIKWESRITSYDYSAVDAAQAEMEFHSGYSWRNEWRWE